ncbi:MAG: GNAT family N-acetyltransferase [Phormidesmis sp.]
MRNRYEIRAARTQDVPVLWTMLMYAAHESSVAVVKTNPDLARYVRGWGKAGAVGAIAEQSGTAVGAAWLCLWSSDNKGYGYVSDEIPELAIAVLPAFRAQGIGTALLKQVLAMAQNHFPAVSLSIRVDNPALRLYERTAFVLVPKSEVTNRTGSVSATMVCRF